MMVTKQHYVIINSNRLTPSSKIVLIDVMNIIITIIIIFIVHDWI